MITRRQWIAAAALAPLLKATMPRPLGAQLYTVRNILMKEPDRVLKTIAEIGYTEVEGDRADLLNLKAKIRQYGLKPISCHVEAPLITQDWKLFPQIREISLEDAIASAKDAGVTYFTLAYIMPASRTGLDSFRRVADRMNQAGELCRKAGLQMAYHNHAYEFSSFGGTRPIDLYFERFDPKLVAMEFDVFWLSVAVQDVLATLKKWAGRVQLLHLKDMAKDTPHQFTESGLPKDAFQEVGSGVIDFPAILKAAPAAGVRQYIVEQDQTPGDPLASLRKSFDYLKTL